MKHNKNKKGNFPNLRFPEFEGEWEERKLGQDCEILMCKRIFASQTTEDGDVPFYKIGTIGKTADTYISQELYEEYQEKYNLPQKGEVLITCSGTVGRCVVYDGKDAYFQDSNIVWINNPLNIIPVRNNHIHMPIVSNASLTSSLTTNIAYNAMPKGIQSNIVSKPNLKRCSLVDI